MGILKKSNVLAAFVALFCLTTLIPAFPAEAAMGNIRSFELLSDADTDVVGKGTTIAADGKKDAGFSVTLTGAGAITRVTLKNLTANKTWDSSRSGAEAILAVRGGEKDSILNSSGSLGLFPFILGTEFTIWINDREEALAKDATFELTVHFVDNTSTKQKVDVKGIAREEPESEAGATAQGQIVSADYLGRKDVQLSGQTSVRGHTIDNKAAKLIVEAKVRGKGTIVGLRLKNVGSPAGTWDTDMDDASKLLIVSAGNGAILNKTDGSVSLAIDGERRLLLIAEDESALASTTAKTELYVYMDGNRVFKMPVKRAAPGDSSVAVGSSGDFKSLSFRGRGSYDFVGEDPKPGSNLNPDYAIALAPKTAGTVTGIKIVGSWPSGKEQKTVTWDTVPTSKNHAIVLTRADGKPLNRLDGSVSERIEAGEELLVWFDTDEDVSRNHSFKVTLLYSDGKVVTGEVSARPR